VISVGSLVVFGVTHLEFAPLSRTAPFDPTTFPAFLLAEPSGRIGNLQAGRLKAVGLQLTAGL
jgi:hypothetical protein